MIKKKKKREEFIMMESCIAALVLERFCMSVKHLSQLKAAKNEIIMHTLRTLQPC